MTVLRGLYWPALLMTVVGCSMSISGCSTTKPASTAQESPVVSATVESATPSWTRSDPAATTNTAQPPSRKPAAKKAVAGEFTALPAGAESQDSERHREKLLQSTSSALEASDLGYYMDTQEARLIQLLDNSSIAIERNRNNILLRLNGGNLFASNSARLTAAAASLLQPAAGVLEEYSASRITIYTHTDDIGDADYNLQLSERRARTIARLMVSTGVDAERIAIAGRGEAEPLFTNDNEANRDRNRRIEILIEPLSRQDE